MSGGGRGRCGVLVEEAGVVRFEEIRRGVGEGDGQLGVSGGLKYFGACLADFRAADEDEFGGLEGGERGEEAEALVEEEADGEKSGSGVGEGVLEDVGVWVVEDDGGEAGIVRGEREGERGRDAVAVRDDA